MDFAISRFAVKPKQVRTSVREKEVLATPSFAARAAIASMSCSDPTSPPRARALVVLGNEHVRAIEREEPAHLPEALRVFLFAVDACYAPVDERSRAFEDRQSRSLSLTGKCKERVRSWFVCYSYRVARRGYALAANDRLEACELLSEPGRLPTASRPQAIRQRTCPLSYLLFDLCMRPRKQLVGRDSKHHLARECGRKVWLPSQPLKAGHLRPGPTPKEKSHLVLSETAPLPVCAQVAVYPGRHKSCRPARKPNRAL